tara:strand:- start:373 stop:510 length:138 start_codon:yes stop_codon:yes gene_type:complete
MKFRDVFYLMISKALALEKENTGNGCFADDIQKYILALKERQSTS